ncbi:hypothetical protein T492DRAFT_1139068 [Pavlovales sp. CCMP2436]|nr:hypothetical protein T492DRAFT_1139068 [Pavlovales sp. CCMP2436]
MEQFNLALRGVGAGARGGVMPISIHIPREGRESVDSSHAGSEATATVNQAAHPQRYCSIRFLEFKALATASLHAQVVHAQRARSAQRFRVTFIPLALGIVFAAIGMVLTTISEFHAFSMALGRCLLYMCLPLLLLSAPSTDTRAVVLLLLLTVIYFGYGAILSIQLTFGILHSVEARPMCGQFLEVHLHVHKYIVLTATTLLLSLLLLFRLAQRAAPLSVCASLSCGLLRSITTRQLLAELWRSCAIVYGICLVAWLGLIFVYSAILPAFYQTQVFSTMAAPVPGLFIATFFCSNTRVRALVHAWLAARGQGVSAAAGVAALIGNAHPKDAIAEGRRRLRSVSVALLEADVFTSSVPSNRFTNMAVPAELDSIDAFVSHSWHDDPMDKWAALQEWRAEFVERNHREPIVWIDRCCILVSGGDLPSLSIFLSGCRKLLILAGPTFLNRLWCVVELFVFEEMHPFDFETASDATLSSHVELRRLPGCDLAGFERFNVEDAVCFVPQDAERLLACIEVSCGSVEDFNTRTRQLLWRLRTLWVSENFSPTSAARALAMSPGSSNRAVGAINEPGAPAIGRWEQPRLRGYQTAPFVVSEGTSLDILASHNASATPPAATRGLCGRACAACKYGSARWFQLCVMAVVLVLYAALFTPYANRVSVPILADCAACAEELRSLSVDADGWMYESEQARAARSGRAYRFSDAPMHHTHALSRDAAAAECAVQGGRLAQPSSAAEERLLRCIMGRAAYGAWTDAHPADEGRRINWAKGQEPRLFGKSVLAVVMFPWGWGVADCAGGAGEAVEERLEGGGGRRQKGTILVRREGG